MDHATNLDAANTLAIILVVLFIASLVVVPFFLMWLIMKLPWPEESRRETEQDQDAEASNDHDV